MPGWVTWGCEPLELVNPGPVLRTSLDRATLPRDGQEFSQTETVGGACGSGHGRVDANDGVANHDRRISFQQVSYPRANCIGCMAVGRAQECDKVVARIAEENVGDPKTGSDVPNNVPYGLVTSGASVLGVDALEVADIDEEKRVTLIERLGVRDRGNQVLELFRVRKPGERVTSRRATELNGPMERVSDLSSDDFDDSAVIIVERMRIGSVQRDHAY